MVKTLQEVARETLARYKDGEGNELFPNPAILVIKPVKGTTAIDFEWFIDHLAEDYQKMLDDHEDYLREGE